MTESEDVEYSISIFGLIKVELWIFILIINLSLLIVSYIAYRIIFFHGYQVTLDKTLHILEIGDIKSTEEMTIGIENTEKEEEEEKNEIKKD